MLQPHRIFPFLRAFEAVTRLGYVRSAAAELHLTPGAVSHQIKMLEQTLDVDLFERASRKLILTPRGKAFQQSVLEIFRDLDRGLQAIAPDRPGEPEKSLSISAPSGLGHIWLAPQLLGIADQLGLPSVECHVAREVAQVNWRRVDIAIVYDNPPWAGYSWLALPELWLGPVCTPSQLNKLPVRNVRDLLQHCFLHEDSGDEWKRWLNAARLKADPVRNAYFNHLSMAFHGALAGEGVALVSDFLAHDYLRKGQLVRPVDIVIPAAKQYFLVTLESRRHEPFVARALDLLMSLVRKQR
jgi:LysR family glycine cleavage system transcriptional activator